MSSETILRSIMNMGYTLLVLIFLSLVFAWNDITGSATLILVLVSLIIALLMIIVPIIIIRKSG
ncbi:MAG: hypothetical protein QXX94_04595 [Candidatus Bathyarchaeia archaeon]